MTQSENGQGVPVQPDGWTVAQLGTHGLILTCDGLQIRLSRANAERFFDIIENEGLDNVQTDDGFWIEVDADAEDGNVIIRLLFTSEKIVNNYPDGVVLDSDSLAKIGVSIDVIEIDDDSDAIEEGVKRAYRRSGKKLKRGFRVTSGIRKGRVVANIKTAHKPRAPAATRMKLRMARKKKKLIRVLKSKRTRRKSLSKRLRRLNSR